MTNRILYFTVILCCLMSCSKHYVYRVEGKLSNLEDKTVYIVYEREDHRVVDSVVCEGSSGKFRFDQKEEGFNCATVLFENKTKWITVYLQPGNNISITGDAAYPLLLQVKGGSVNEKLSAFRKENAALLREMTDLTARYKDSNDNSAEATNITSHLSNTHLELTEKATAYIKTHPDEEASVVLIQTYFTKADDTRKMDELLALIDPELKNFYLVKEMEQYSARAKRTAIGAEAPGFTITNIYGKSITLDSLANKYVLLTFTAPWCDMCQTEDLYLDKVAMKYPKDKLDILVISLDDDQPTVREVLKGDSIQWNLVTDSAGQASMLLDLYNVRALPLCFLIDEEGKILLKTENGIEIKQTLEKLLDEE